MNSLVKTRQFQLDQQTAELAKIRREKLILVEKLRQHQNEYLKGVDTLNEERQSANRLRLPTLERAVDTSKSLWYQSLKKVREVEETEKAQISEVLGAMRNLKSVEFLQDKYQQNYAEAVKQQEQKQLDEIAVQKFARKQTEN